MQPRFLLTSRLLTSLLVATACSCGSPMVVFDAGGDAGSMDGAADGGPIVSCAADTDCDDEDFCTGTERCLPGDPGEDARGCVAGSDPCNLGQTCDEVGDRCVDDTCPPDGDGDGITTCEGDCDDTRNDINPTRAEVCVLSAPGVVDSTDEDCSPITFGNVDGDRDGAVSASCFNVDGEGLRRGGTDCDDTNPSISPLAAEMCDGPDGVDENCNGMRDEGCACSPEGSTRPCGIETGECTVGTEQCTALGWGTCSGTPIVAENCNHLDDDCDGSIDNGLGVAPCSRSVAPTTAIPGGGLRYNYTCVPTAAGCDGTLSSGTAAGRPPQGSHLDWRGDLGRRSVISAEVMLRNTRTDGKDPSGELLLILATNRAPGAETGPFSAGVGGALPLLAPSDRAVGVLYAAASLSLVYFDGASWQNRAPVGWYCPPSTIARGYTVTLSNDGALFTGTVSASGCPTTSTMTDMGARWAQLYGSVSPYPLYFAGVVADDDGYFSASISRITVERRSSSLDRNNCVGCL